MTFDIDSFDNKIVFTKITNYYIKLYFINNVFVKYMEVLWIILNEHNFNKYSFNSMWQGLTVSV